MNLTVLLDMVAEGMPGRVLVGRRGDGLTGAALARQARAGAGLVRAAGAGAVLYLGGNGPALPVALFAAACARVPFLPVNYRLGDQQLDDVLARQDSPLVITDTPGRAGDRATMTAGEFMRAAAGPADGEPGGGDERRDIDPGSVAVLLMTSGTTASPKSAVLRHRHLMSYILGSVEFMSADEGDATIVSVPPYHIAAVANLLSNLYAGRRIVYLDHFTARDWLRVVAEERVSHAMVVPTMLVRIVDELRSTGRPAPGSLRSISYGGAAVPAHVLVEALRLFPETGFVNAYGLTETASSVAVLGPEDHREALASPDPAVRARLLSVGRALPGVEIEVRDPEGGRCAPGQTGSIVVRGAQVAGEYLETGSRVDPDGWFPTRDIGRVDEAGFIFVEGRSDDTIIRGGENVAPSEIEAVICEHESVGDCAVVGLPDTEWGQRIAAFVVPRPGTEPDADALRGYVRERLRGSKTPDEIVFLDELPVTATGKVLRRKLAEMVAPRDGGAAT